MYTITVFTPTFNRGYALSNLYKSLCLQINQNFVWLLVDDGSTDNTEEIVNEWKNEQKVKIVYTKKENGGKHTAINLGIKLCTTPLFVCVDSDDFLTTDAVNILCNQWNREDQEGILGLYGRQGDYSGIAMGENWPIQTKYARMNELYNKYKYNGETIMVFRTDIIKEYTFPVFEDEKFVTESAFYDQFDRVLPMRLINDIIYLSEYQKDGYTAQGMKLHLYNPKGYAYFLKQRAALNINVKIRLICSIKYYTWIKANNLKGQPLDAIKIPFWLRFVGEVLSIFFGKKYTDLRGKSEL